MELQVAISLQSIQIQCAPRKGDIAQAFARYFDDTWEGGLKRKLEEKVGTFVSCGCQILIYTNGYMNRQYFSFLDPSSMP